MSQPTQRHTNRLLGYPDDARLLIINADDFGMCHAANAAITRSLTAGVVTSTTLMVPCAWALHAVRWRAARLACARKLRDEGGGRAGLGLYAIMLPVLAVASFRPNFIDYYPMSGWVRGEIAVYAGGGSNAHLTSFVLYEFACLHNPEFLIRATAELWYVSLGQSGRQRRGTRRR